MNVSGYTRLLANPSDLLPEDLQELDAILSRYPYFQSARALQLKGLKNADSYRYNDALRLTAAHTTDRDVLFDYITSERFSQNEVSEQILQNSEAVRAMDVVSEDLSAQISLELENQLRGEMKKAEAILDPELFERKVESIEQLAEETETAPVEAETSSPEETLELDKPLEFSKEDTHSFAEWLKLTQATPIDRTATQAQSEVPKSQPAPKTDIQRKFDLIDKFIQSEHKLDPSREAKPKKNLAKPYTQRPDSMMTETLAKVYLQQKNYKKAIQAYEILILKNPEKSGFFADQIRAIKQLIKKEEK